MLTDPFHIIEPYQPTFVSDQTLEPRPIEEAIEGATGAVLGDGLSFFGMSATVPAGFSHVWPVYSWTDTRGASQGSVSNRRVEP